MVLDGDGHSGFGSYLEVRLHCFNEFSDFFFQFLTLEAFGAATSGDHRAASKTTRQLHLVLKAEGSEFVLRDAAQHNIVGLQHLSKFLFAKTIKLFSLVAVDFGPDVDRRRAGLFDLRENLANVEVAVHAGAEEVVEGKCVGASLTRFGQQTRTEGGGDHGSLKRASVWRKIHCG